MLLDLFVNRLHVRIQVPCSVVPLGRAGKRVHHDRYALEHPHVYNRAAI